MRANTKKRKKATVMVKATQEQEWWADQVVQVMLHGKRALDAAMLDVGRLVAETLMYMEREERSGPDYHPTSSGLMNPNRKIFEARKRETAALGAGEKLVLGHPPAATIGDSARCMQNLEKVLFTGPKTSDTVTFICD